MNSLNSSSIQFWISISNGIHKHEILIPIIYSDIVENGQLKQGTIIKITQCSWNIVRNIMYVQFSLSFPLNKFHNFHGFNVCLSFISNILHLTGLSHCLHLRLSQWMQQLLEILHLTTYLYLLPRRVVPLFHWILAQ